MVTSSDEDALAKLINRAQVFRQTLQRSVSTRHPGTNLDLLLSQAKRHSSTSSNSSSLDRLVENILTDDDDDACETLESSKDRDEASLLDELFFSGRKKTPQPNKPMHRVQSPEQGGALRLLVTVGKLVLLEPGVKDFTKVKPTILGHFGSNTSVLPNCTSLLTFFFPPVFDAHGLKLCPEQRISISPAHVQTRTLQFDYKSQLFWSREAHDEWCIQPVKTTLYLRWQTGEALECYGYISLESLGRGTGSMQTSLVLVGGKDTPLKDQSIENQDPAIKVPPRHLPKTKVQLNVNESLVRSDRNKMDAKPVASVDVGMMLMGESASRRHVTRFVQTQEEEPWIYLNLQGLITFFAKLNSTAISQSMLLVVKSGSKAIFVSMRLQKLKQKFLDAVLQPSPGAECMLFLEVWRSLRAYEGLEEEQGLEGLAGMLKVPYSLESWKSRKSKQGAVKFSGSFKAWHPSKTDVTGKVDVVVVLGLRNQVLRMQKENHAAAIIQYFYKRSLLRGKFRRSPSKKTPSLQRPFSQETTKDNTRHVKLSKKSRTLHVFEVNVQKLVGLPSQSQHKVDRIFIKYIFPGEPDPFFTPESDWKQDIVFEACVQHKVSLPSNASVRSYINTIDRNAEGLRFEIWRAGENEERFGTATLSQQSLLDLVNSSRHHIHQTRRVFQLPVAVDIHGSDRLSGKLKEPKLVVEVGYNHVEYPEDLLHGTIFADSPPGCFETELDIKILRARGLENFSLGTQVSLNPYVRFSLFPSNRELELLYPPSVTPFKENSVSPCFGSSNTLRVPLTPDIVDELRKSTMNFELWHHSSKARRRSSSSAPSTETDVWLATASAPCSSLLTNRKGVTGWLPLAPRKKGPVGKLEVDVSFSTSRTTT